MTEGSLPDPSDTATARRRQELFAESFGRVKAQIQKVIVGNDAIVDGVLIALLAGGHVLLEGVPGLGKTLLVRTLARALDLSFSRIQFTPDLMPADITGTTILAEDAETGRREFRFAPGPVFGNIVLADEINRATPRTQSALLEAMQEQSVTVNGVTHLLEPPFIVLATQNPIEMEGTYSLPEAQMDRFLFKLIVPSPTLSEIGAIIDRTTGVEALPVDRVLQGVDIMAMRHFSRQVLVAPHVRDFAANIILATQPTVSKVPAVSAYVRYGASPRGAQALILTAKVRALLAGRYNVAYEDIRAVALPALRHRILLNFEGESEQVAVDKIIEDIVKAMTDRVSVKAA